MVGYRHNYDEVIIKPLSYLGECIVDESGEHFNLLAMTFTMLFRLIKKTYPTISKTTLQRHLNKMVKQGILARSTTSLLPSAVDAGTAKRTFYSLSKDTYVDIRDGQRYPRIRSNREPRTK